MAAIGITLCCDVCREENYRKRKNKVQHQQRLKFRKYCRKCRTHQVHTEKK